MRYDIHEEAPTCCVFQSSPGVSVFVLFHSAPDKRSRETMTAETPSWWRPTHPSLHSSNPLAAVYYTNKINTISSCFSAVRSLFCWCGGLFYFFCASWWAKILAADLLEATSVLLCRLSFPCQIPWDGVLLRGLCNLSSSSSSSSSSLSLFDKWEDASAGLPQSRELREEHQTASQPGPGAKDSPQSALCSQHDITVQSVQQITLYITSVLFPAFLQLVL